jgi:hypothetical protein
MSRSFWQAWTTNTVRDSTSYATESKQPCLKRRALSENTATPPPPSFATTPEWQTTTSPDIRAPLSPPESSSAQSLAFSLHRCDRATKRASTARSSDPDESIRRCQVGSPLHFHLNSPVTQPHFLPAGGTKAHSLVETSGSLIALNNLQSHRLGAL